MAHFTRFFYPVFMGLMALVCLPSVPTLAQENPQLIRQLREKGYKIFRAKSNGKIYVRKGDKTYLLQNGKFYRVGESSSGGRPQARESSQRTTSRSGGKLEYKKLDLGRFRAGGILVLQSSSTATSTTFFTGELNWAPTLRTSDRFGLRLLLGGSYLNVVVQSFLTASAEGQLCLWLSDSFSLNVGGGLWLWFSSPLSSDILASGDLQYQWGNGFFKGVYAGYSLGVSSPQTHLFRGGLVFGF